MKIIINFGSIFCWWLFVTWSIHDFILFIFAQVWLIFWTLLFSSCEFTLIFDQICSSWLSFAQFKFIFAQFLFIFVQFMSIFIKICLSLLIFCSFLLSLCQFFSVLVYFCSVIDYLCSILFQSYVTKLMHISEHFRSNSSEQFNAFPRFFCNTITPINKQFFFGLLHQHQNIYIVPATARRQEKRGNNSFCREWICFNIFFVFHFLLYSHVKDNSIYASTASDLIS